MTTQVDGISEPTPLEQDKTFIEVTGEPLRDEEMLSWDNLYFDSKFKVIRCKTCGCPAELCTCSKIPDDKIEDNCICCLQPLTIEQKSKGICASCEVDMND